MKNELDDKFAKQRDAEMVKKFKDRNTNSRKACVVSNRFTKVPRRGKV